MPGALMMAMLLQSAAPQALPVNLAPPVRGPSPAGNPGGWVTQQDYPQAALKAGEQGITGFLLDIDRAGGVANCSITQTSGSPDLDQATCNLIMARAHFNPGLDVHGQAVPGRYRNRVKWVFAESPPKTGVSVTRMTVTSDGQVLDCSVELSGDMANNAGVPVTTACSTANRYEVGYRDATNNPVTRRVVITRKVEVFPMQDNLPAVVAGGR